VNEVKILELGPFLGVAVGAYFGATLGLQHSFIWAVISGAVGALLGLCGGLLAAVVFLMLFQSVPIIINTIENRREKR
jgi:uncharacterized membrane protein